MKTIAVRNCKFVSELLEDTTLSEGDLLFKDGKIAAITTLGTHFENVDEEIDACGMTALPGLIDAHLHLNATCKMVAEQEFFSPCKHTMNELMYARHLLGLGYTTIRDMGDYKWFPAIAVRDAINQGIIMGPRLLCCGMGLIATEPGQAEWRSQVCNCDSPDDYRLWVRKMWQAHADFIKFYSSGSMMAEGSVPDQITIEEDELIQCVKTANARGLYCASHAHGADAIYMAVRNGVSTIEHASFIDDRSLDLLANSANCGIVPTLGINADILENVDPATEYGKFVIAKVRPLMARVKECIGHAYKRGDILIGFGTDAPMTTYLKEPGVEFRMRHDFMKFENIDILKQATINNAKLLRIDNITGSIKVGKCADVILADGDPAVDITVMYKPAERVFCKGEKFK